MSAKIAAKQPVAQNLETDKKYFWCSCGYSQKQPFCDGSHNAANKEMPAGGTAFKPLAFSIPAAAEKWLCNCKQTKNPPYCDGSHKNL